MNTLTWTLTPSSSSYSYSYSSTTPTAGASPCASATNTNTNTNSSLCIRGGGGGGGYASASASASSSSSSFITTRITITNNKLVAAMTMSLRRIQCAATKPPKSPAEQDWSTKRKLLLEKKVRSVDVKEALRLQNENNFVILDVRPQADFKQVHPPGAINVQIYRLIKEWTAWDIARRLAFAFFGIFQGTEENPDFIQSVESKLNKDSAKIIVACSSGGTMKPTQNLPEGQQSRSLIAAYLLVLNGYKNVYHLEGGLYNWSKQGLPVVSEE